MTHAPVSDHQRIEELLADRAVQGLSPVELEELDVLLAKFPETDVDEFDYAAATIELALHSGPPEQMPTRLRESVESAAVSFLATRQHLKLSQNGSTSPPARSSSARWKVFAPWIIAAASLALAVIITLPTRDAPLRVQRDALMSQPNTVLVKWAPNDMGVSGDVVWNADQQQGYLRFQGLGVNSPTDFQYQLWIFDAQRKFYSDFTAVDGGVFDVASSTEEMIIPIDAKLDVFDPELFAITTEPPGGVVKHNPDADPDRFKIILTAAPASSG